MSIEIPPLKSTKLKNQLLKLKVLRYSCAIYLQKSTNLSHLLIEFWFEMLTVYFRHNEDHNSGEVSKLEKTKSPPQLFMAVSSFHT